MGKYAATALGTLFTASIAAASVLAATAPIGFADEAEILSGSKVLATVAATCSTTACTVTLPAESARTVDIKIFAESLWESAKTRGDRYRYT